MKEVIIYSKQMCPYCDRAKKLLEEKSITNYKEIRIDIEPNERENMIKLTNRMTVPQIFIDNIHIGGFDDLAKLNHEGKLDHILGLK